MSHEILFKFVDTPSLCTLGHAERHCTVKFLNPGSIYRQRLRHKIRTTRQPTGHPRWQAKACEAEARHKWYVPWIHSAWQKKKRSILGHYWLCHHAPNGTFKHGYITEISSLAVQQAGITCSRRNITQTASKTAKKIERRQHSPTNTSKRKKRGRKNSHQVWIVTHERGSRKTTLRSAHKTTVTQFYACSSHKKSQVSKV